MWHDASCWALYSLEKEIVVAASSYADHNLARSLKKWPHGGQLFQHSLDRWVKIKVRPAVSLRKDCSEQVCGSCWICHGGMNPSGNACLSRRAKQRLDLWIYISDVECIWRAKTLQLHLTGMGRWKDPRNFEKVCHVQF